MTEKKIGVIQYGLGPIGIECVKWILKKPLMEIVGAIDIDPEKSGKPLEKIIKIFKKTGIVISSDASSVLKNSKADVVIHTTKSSLKDVFPQIEEIIKAGKHVISSTEELLEPELQNPDIAEKIDKLAKKAGVAVLGTGVNPGFVMDSLPLCLSSMCLEIKSIKIRRELDAAKRRLPLQKKIGSGLSVDEFLTLKSLKKIGHIGLIESLEFILKGLGWIPDKIIETLDPVVAKKNLKTKYLSIKKGQVCGIKHIAKAIKNKKEIVSLDLRMFVGASESFDSIEIEGVPPIKAKFEGGIAGDYATVAALINSIPRIISSPPGLKSMRDLSLPFAFDAIK